MLKIYYEFTTLKVKYFSKLISSKEPYLYTTVTYYCITTANVQSSIKARLQ